MIKIINDIVHEIYSLFIYFLSNQAYYCDIAGWSIPSQLSHPFGDFLFAMTERFLTPYVLLAP